MELKTDTKIQLNVMENKLKTIVDTLNKPKKKKVKPLPLRDGITDTIFAEIMRTRKPKGAQRLSWSRFRIACVILFFTGLKAGEVAYTTRDMIESLRKNKRCQYYQPKVNSMRTCYVTEVSEKYFDLIERDIIEVYDRPDPDPDAEEGAERILYPFIKTSRDKWIKLLNTKLDVFAKKYNLRLSSHSFKISYVTRILKHSSIERAQRFVGHKDLRSTQAYNRYQMGDEESFSILERSYQSNDL